MYYDCDHLITENKVFTIRGNWPDTATMVLAKPVYERKNLYEDFKKIVDRKGLIGENLEWINPVEYKHILCKGIDIEEYCHENSLWSTMVNNFLKLGINANDIGVFGSKKLCLKSCRDVDFVIYGKENFDVIRKHIEWFKRESNLSNQTVRHAIYQAEKHGAFFDDSVNNLLMCLIRKWSTCAINETMTTTIRFVDTFCNSGNILKQYFYGQVCEDEITIRGIVIDEKTSFMPRRFILKTHHGFYEVITPLWIFFQCVRKNDLVEVTGTLVDNKILVRRYSHGIKHL